ncbi:hypothetical protein ACT29H_08355, partial [Thermophagus sp. OGC60D27]|uniref:hypothetical protein n=1 Tax=Thermophagus sp. OGC60D27 TaxID=3458415 RepID=UPI00403829FA
KLAMRITDSDQLKAVLNTVDEMGITHKGKFLDDVRQIDDVAKFDGGLVEAWKKMDNLGADDALRQNTGALEALAKPKGSRPDPSEYLDADYIENHLSKFEGGGSRLVAKSDFETYGVGKPDAGKTEFVFPNTEMDEILSLPVAEQAKILGVPVEQLQNGSLVRIDFKPTNKIDMPSGNEFGANTEWIPGGKTSGGINEAVIKTDGMQLDIDYTVTDL